MSLISEAACYVRSAFVRTKFDLTNAKAAGERRNDCHLIQQFDLRVATLSTLNFRLSIARPPPAASLPPPVRETPTVSLAGSLRWRSHEESTPRGRLEICRQRVFHWRCCAWLSRSPR